MFKRVKKHLPLLKWLSTAKPKEQKSVILVLYNDALKAIHKGCVNVFKGNVPLSHPQKQKLIRCKKVIWQLGGKKQSECFKETSSDANGRILGCFASTHHQHFGEFAV